MKTFFIAAEAEADIIPVLKKALKVLPESVGIVTTAQHMSKLDEAKEFLEKNNKKVEIGGQVLGCNAKNAEKLETECILFIGSGKFHAIGIKNKKVIIANPFTNEVEEVDKEEIRKIENLRKSALMKFHSAEKVGVILSTKKGQSVRICREKLENKYENKKFYYFACDTLHLGELENFPFIQAWINTMCPRIGYEDLLKTRIAMVNLEDV